MKKSTKLLSVLLAVLMVFSSISVLAFAAPVKYKSVADLKAMNNNAGAYSEYGQATRIPTDARVSILMDFIDDTLEPLNIYPGTVVDVAGVTVTVDLRNIDGICSTLDTVKSALTGFAGTLAKPMLGIVGHLRAKAWPDGMRRAKVDPQTKIFWALANFISHPSNKDVIMGILRTGKIDLGVASSAVAGVDLSMIADLPGLIKGMAFPLLARWDDDATRMKTLQNTAGNAGVESVLKMYIEGMITKNVSITNYNEDVATGKASHSTLPVVKAVPTTMTTRCLFVANGTGADKTFTRYHWEFNKPNSNDFTGKYVAENRPEDIYYAVLEGDHYRFTRFTNGDKVNGKQLDNLVWYADNTPALHTMNNKNANGIPSLIEGITPADFDVSKKSAAELLYFFLPYIYRDMAPIAANGSLKKEMAWLFGARFNYIGERNSTQLAEAIKGVANEGNFFTKDAEVYIWDYSDYAVINGEHYWRFKDGYYKADLSGINPFFNIIDWSYRVPVDFIDKYVAQMKKDNNLLGQLNDMLADVAAMVLVGKQGAKDTYVLPTSEAGKTVTVTWQRGDNTKLLDNIQNFAQGIVKVSPESILGTNYDLDDRYYDMIMNEGTTPADRQEILTGLACTLVKMLMPQMVLPTGDTFKAANKGTQVGAIFAAVLREVATQFLPSVNYDALIYAGKDGYDTKTFLSGKDNAYWLDVCATIGTDIGISYLMNLADMGPASQIASAMKFSEKKTYTNADLMNGSVKTWESRLDYLIDWALDPSLTYGWKFGAVVTGVAGDITKAEDPWAKAQKLLDTYLDPVLDLFHIEKRDAKDAQWLKNFAVNDLVLSVLNGDLTHILNLFAIQPNNALLKSAADGGILAQIVPFVKGIVNPLFKNLLANNDLIGAKVTSLDTLANQDNICDIVDIVLAQFKHMLGGNAVGDAECTGNSDNGILAPLMPLVSRFVGWKMYAQELQRPSVYLSNSDGLNYVCTASASNTIKVANNASGMLLTHRNGADDQNYDMILDAVTCEGLTDGAQVGSVALPANKTIHPGEKAELTYSKPARVSDQPLKITLTYHFMFKDGKTLSDEKQTVTFYTFMSEKKTDINTKQEQKHGGTGGIVSATVNPSLSKLDAASIQNAINSLTVSIGNTNKSFGTGGNSSYGSFDDKYIVSNNDNYTGTGKGEIIVLHPAKAVAGADYSIFKSGDSINIGKVTGTITYSRKTFNFTLNLNKLWLYDTAALEALFNRFAKSDVQASYFANADAEYKAFQDAMLNAAKLLKQPKMVRTFASDYSVENIKAVTEALQTAAKNLFAKKSNANTIGVVETAMDTCEPANKPEVDYQDYELFEFFKYQGVRDPLRARINEYKEPLATLPDYIPSNPNLDKAVIDAAVAADAKYAEAIKQSLKARTQEEQDAQDLVHSNWEKNQPSYTTLENEDAAKRLTYYHDLCVANPRAVDLTFLKDEIRLAKQLHSNAADYSALSYKAYTAALAAAEAVVAKADKALRSEAFAAKYALMKAENALVKTTYFRNGVEEHLSCDEAGYYDNLKNMVAQAKAIFDNAELYTAKTADAWGQLLTALGYTDANGVVFYPNAAEEFLKNDRIFSKNEGARIDAQVQNLKAALANFECKVKLAPMENTTTQVSSDGSYIINGINPASILNEEAFNKYVKTVAPQGVAVDRVLTSAKAGYFGTGTTAVLKVKDSTLATYTLVIYGDVNGDGAVDAFDAALLDRAITDSSILRGTTALAGDVAADDGAFTSADYNAVVEAVKGGQAINQVR